MAVVVVASVMSSAHPVAAQSAVQEASRVVCSGALGQGIFLVAGVLALALFIGGILQLGVGFFQMGGGGGGGMQRQASGRQGVMNGALTLTGGLVLGSVGGVLSYLGVDISACLSTDNIISVAPALSQQFVEFAVIAG